LVFGSFSEVDFLIQKSLILVKGCATNPLKSRVEAARRSPKIPD